MKKILLWRNYSVSTKKEKTFFVLCSTFRNIDFVEDRLHFGKTQIYLVFRSICTIFAAEFIINVKNRNMKRKEYEKPAMQVFELKQRPTLLVGSAQDAQGEDFLWDEEA